MIVGKLAHSVFEAAYNCVKASDDRIVELKSLEVILADVIADYEKKEQAKVARVDGTTKSKTRTPKWKPVVTDEIREAVLDLLATVAPLNLTRTVQVEQPWSIMTSHGEIVGVFDRIDEVIDERSGEVVGYEVIDYKTGGFVQADQDLPHDAQVQLYLLAAR
jgi:hypothetical protein